MITVTERRSPYAPQLVSRRSQDPGPYKEELIDGRKVWPKTIDPLTGRPAPVPTVAETPGHHRYKGQPDALIDVPETVDNTAAFA